MYTAKVPMALIHRGGETPASIIEGTSLDFTKIETELSRAMRFRYSLAIACDLRLFFQDQQFSESPKKQA
jgi:hypothetical protein